MDQFERENMRWAPRSQPAKGPRRLCKFCLLGITLPVILLCIPLYMRFVYLRPFQFVLSPSDMKLLNHEHRVSTTWCQAQTLRMNSTFNAYILPDKPRIQSQRNRVKMERKILNLEDDMKEYWGFYLLKDSFFRLSVCSRHEGASMVIIKHSKNVARCAWLGELDSAEESDELSNEFDFQQEVIASQREENLVENMTSLVESQEEEKKEDMTKIVLSKYSDELSSYLENMEQWSIRSQKTIVRSLLDTILKQRLGSETETEIQKLSGLLVNGSFTEEEVVTEDIQRDGGEATKEYIAPQAIVGRREYYVGEGGEEGEDGEVNLDHLFNKGRFDQNNQENNKVDKSDEETRSSWSSSEEALEACEGAIFNIPLNGATKCHANATFEEMEEAMVNVGPYVVDSTGFYYFIFTNENEITSNFLGVKFELHKTVFDVKDNEASCINSTSCKLPLDFMSHQHVVLEVPQSDSETCEYETEVETNYHQCNTIVHAESVCEPRGTVYMFFLLLVPVFILVFAYV